EPTIRWIADAMTILQTSEGALDWEVFVAEARVRSLQLHVRHGLGYLREAFHAPIPDAAWMALERAPVPVLERVEFDVLTRRDATERDRLRHLGPLLALEYLRITTGAGLATRLRSLPGFLRYRLRARREPLILGARRVARWLGLGQ